MTLYDKIKHGIRFWLLRRLPTCKQTTEVISQGMERPLTMKERVLLKLHLWVCAWCQWYLEHLQVIRNTLRTPVSEDIDVSSATLGTEARERIKRRISGDS